MKDEEQAGKGKECQGCRAGYVGACAPHRAPDVLQISKSATGRLSHAQLQTVRAAPTGHVQRGDSVTPSSISVCWSLTFPGGVDIKIE